MGKQASQTQINQLKSLNESLSKSSTMGDSMGTSVHILQILEDIDKLSTFSTNLSMEIMLLKTNNGRRGFHTIISITDNAIKYYTGLI